MKVRRISSQGDNSFRETYREMGQDLGQSWQSVGDKMLNFIGYLEKTPEHPDIWAYTSLSSLVLAKNDDYRSGLVRVSVEDNTYKLEYPSQPELPPFLGKTNSSSFADIDIAVSVALKIFDELVSSTNS